MTVTARLFGIVATALDRFDEDLGDIWAPFVVDDIDVFAAAVPAARLAPVPA